MLAAAVGDVGLRQTPSRRSAASTGRESGSGERVEARRARRLANAVSAADQRSASVESSAAPNLRAIGRNRSSTRSRSRAKRFHCEGSASSGATVGRKARHVDTRARIPEADPRRGVRPESLSSAMIDAVVCAWNSRRCMHTVKPPSRRRHRSGRSVGRPPSGPWPRSVCARSAGVVAGPRAIARPGDREAVVGERGGHRRRIDRCRSRCRSATSADADRPVGVETDTVRDGSAVVDGVAPPRCAGWSRSRIRREDRRRETTRSTARRGRAHPIRPAREVRAVSVIAWSASSAVRPRSRPRRTRSMPSSAGRCCVGGRRSRSSRCRSRRRTR